MTKTNLTHSLTSSNAPGTLEGDIRGIKAPVPIPHLWFWVWGLAGLILALALVFWWRRRRKKKQVGPAPVPVVPPHIKARAKLEEARALMDQPRPFCILVSDTIRVYLEERFRLHAPERTTEEFLEELQSSAVLSYEQKATLGQFLVGCDLVKFARYEPGQGELESIYQSAVRLVEETQPAPAVAVEAASPSRSP